MGVLGFTGTWQIAFETIPFRIIFFFFYKIDKLLIFLQKNDNDPFSVESTIYSWNKDIFTSQWEAHNDNEWGNND